jgi:hypothetical protein
MIFVSIPDNGSSWRDRLLYSFATESEQQQDVEVEILNTTTGSVLGSMRLYGVTQGVVDIAPYVRPHVSMKFMETTRQADLKLSPSAISVVVRINGVESEARVFFRSQFDYDSMGALSTRCEPPVVLEGDTIRMTLFAKSRVEAQVTLNAAKTIAVKCEGQSNGMPMELVIPTKNISQLEGVVVNMRLDGKYTAIFNYAVKPRYGTSQRLVWYNQNGGVDSYTFDHAIRLGYSVERGDGCMCDEGAKRVDGRVRYRLCSGYEQQDVMERVAQLMLSPIVCREVDGICREVAVESREIDFDSKGLLHTISLNLSEKWRGGAPW